MIGFMVDKRRDFLCGSEFMNDRTGNFARGFEGFFHEVQCIINPKKPKTSRPFPFQSLLASDIFRYLLVAIFRMRDSAQNSNFFLK
jgi:hypothetical protein